MKTAFGNSGVYIEKFGIENPHHIEFQILGDNKGHIIPFRRARLLDSTVRNQKVLAVEESPSPLIEGKFRKLREKMGKAAIRIAGTGQLYERRHPVEFIVDNEGRFYFLEMNKRRSRWNIQ